MHAKLSRSNFTLCTDVHEHNTRSNQNLFLNKCNYSRFMTAPCYSAANLFNKLPDEIKNINSSNIFKNKLKDFLLNKAYYNVKEYCMILL